MKSEAYKMRELEAKIQLQKDIVGLLKTEIGQAIAGVLIASLLDRANLISPSGRAMLEGASIGFAAIKAAQPLYPVITQGIQTGGQVVGDLGKLAGTAALLA
jgi:hypothetical protein